MKKLLALTLGLILMTGIGYCADGEFDKAEVIPDTAKYSLDTVRFLVFTKTCEVTFRGLDATDNPTGDEIKVIFMNIEDDPETPEDETSNEFSQLVNLINNNDNIKTSITTAVKIKLGLN